VGIFFSITSGFGFLRDLEIKEPLVPVIRKFPESKNLGFGVFQKASKNWQFYSRLFDWFLALFRIAVTSQSQLQIFENHGYVSELVIWFSWRTSLRTSGYQFHF
jgi:hypothetical protein